MKGVKVVDVASMSTREINKILRSSRGKIKLTNPNSAHFLAAGLSNSSAIKIEGSAGYYLGTCMDGPNIHVKGNAGWYAGDNMTGGKITIEGSSGDGTGQGIYDGIVVVKGNSGSRTGQLMKGGTILVGGNSGYMTGLYSFGGRIIVCGDVGHCVGESIIGGTIYVGGKIASLGKNASRQKLTPDEYRSINKLLTKFGLNARRKFTKIISLKKRVYHIDIGEG
jgi:glutamate synthase domain-containing protein 3